MGKYQQYLTAIACAFASLVMGLLNVWPSYTISLYAAKNTTILSEPMSELHTSLLGSLPSLGAMLGTAITTTVIDRIGRKYGGVVLSIPYTICWALISISSSSTVILISRFIGGISGGCGLVYAPIFISETAESSIRGTLAAAPIIFYCLGAMISYILGWIYNYHTIIYLNLVTCVFYTVLSALVIESPVFLLKQNRDKEALVAMAEYRGTSTESKLVREEISRLKQQISPAVEMITVSQSDADYKVLDSEKEQLKEPEIIYGDLPKMSPLKLLFVSPSCRRALTVVGVTVTLQIGMGMVTIQVYAKDLFAKAVPDLSSHMCSVLFALTLLAGAVFTSAFADKAGRRILIMSSSTMVGLCMTALGFLNQSQIAPPWVSAVIILGYCFSFSAGAGTVPYILLAECFTTEVQGLASMLLVEWMWFINFFAIAIFPYTLYVVGHHGIFYSYALFAIVNCVISYYIVPETKGLSMEQIQEALCRRYSKSRSLQ